MTHSLELFALDCCDRFLLYLIFLAPPQIPYERGEAARAGEGSVRKPCAGVKVERSKAA